MKKRDLLDAAPNGAGFHLFDRNSISMSRLMALFLGRYTASNFGVR
jgi:hypothetical protein